MDHTVTIGSNIPISVVLKSSVSQTSLLCLWEVSGGGSVTTLQLPPALLGNCRAREPGTYVGEGGH